MRPNVIWVVLDAARADAFEPYGAPAGSTPAAAQLASRGAALTNVFATSSWTVPSHASMFTGLLPRAAGLGGGPGVTPRDCRAPLAAQQERLLAEVLRTAGYRTAAVSANVWVSKASGFDLGFDDFVAVDTERQSRMHGKGRLGRLAWALEASRGDADDGAGAAERVMHEWVSSAPQQPFFWFVNLVECHSPYLPPRPYNDLPLHQRFLAAREARRHLNLDSIWKACVGGFDISPAALERMRHLYGRCIRLLDDWVGRLLEALDRAHLLEDTLVLVTADHGENLGEGNLITHSLSLDDRLLRVPLIAAGPGAPSSNGILSLAELPRITAEAAGLDGHPWLERTLPQGIAVAQLDPPASADDPRSRQAVERWGLGHDALKLLTTPLTCATDGRHKLLRRGAEEVVFDLAADPNEESPIAADSAPAETPVAALRAALDHPAAAVAPRSVAPAAPDAGEPSPDEVARIEDRMRLLGYM